MQFVGNEHKLYFFQWSIIYSLYITDFHLLFFINSILKSQVKM